jgi:hypothetical protein
MSFDRNMAFDGVPAYFRRVTRPHFRRNAHALLDGTEIVAVLHMDRKAGIGELPRPQFAAVARRTLVHDHIAQRGLLPLAAGAEQVRVPFVELDRPRNVVD